MRPAVLSFQAQREICYSLALAFLCAALAVSAHAQMRPGRGSPRGGGFRDGAILGHRGFVSRPFQQHRFFPKPFVPFGVAVPMWWDEPSVIESEQSPPPQPIVVVVNSLEKRSDPPAPTAVPLIIERDGDRYVRRAAYDVAPASQRSPEALNQPAPKPAVLVLRNGQQLELTDYAITTDALYDLHGGRTKKIELSEINLPATRAANNARGVNFMFPNQ